MKGEPRCLVKVRPTGHEDVILVFCQNPKHKHRLVVFSPREVSYLAELKRDGKMTAAVESKLLALKLEFGGSLLDPQQSQQLGLFQTDATGSGSPGSRSRRNGDTVLASTPRPEASSSPKPPSEKASEGSSSSGTPAPQGGGGEKSQTDPGPSGTPSFGDRLRKLRNTKTE